MSSAHGHKHTGSVTQNQKAQLANAYNELGKELSSSKIRVVGNYTLGRVIGEGAYGKVRLGTHRLTSTRVAIKQIPKAMSSSLTREIHHHRQLHHPHVAQMYEVIATESHIWLVTELCCGGELFDYLVEKGRLEEEEARIIFGQLCLAVAHLHDNAIVHRDLKLENVLLDERCRVKLGDFGFAREFERGNYMETFCGTTGYASPEMLQGKKYIGPEVDIWSLGVILYCLLTGTLPFDDDDEAVMRAKIIQGHFEDPEWLSIESRDIIKNILQKDASKRLTIPQILAHSWFTTRQLTYEPGSPVSIQQHLPETTRSQSPDTSSHSISLGPESYHSSETSTRSDSSSKIHVEIHSSTPTTPDETLNDPFRINGTVHKNERAIHRNPSESTIRRTSLAEFDFLSSKISRTADSKPETVVEEDHDEKARSAAPSPYQRSNSGITKPPPTHPARTPARTKRRSVSSTLSDPASPSTDKVPTPLPLPSGNDLDFASLLKTPTPIIFSTRLERDLLNTLSLLGLDTAQIVHSVLTDACDASGAVWWMLKKKAERRMLEDPDQQFLISAASDPDLGKQAEDINPKEGRPSKKKEKRHKASTSVQTDPTSNVHLNSARSAPQLAFVPPTPTMSIRPTTPPQPTTPTRTRSPLLSPSSSTVADSSIRSYPSTPGSTMKEKDSSKIRKSRAGSVSIMQRATTALEAAGLVKKRSSEVVREDKEKEKERSKETERKLGSNEESRSSHGSGTSKITKSPPLKATRDMGTPTTPPPPESVKSTTNIGSPWVLADPRSSLSQQHPHATVSSVTVPGEMLHSHSTPNFSEATPTGKPPSGFQRNRANLLTAFRLWFNEDRKGKRKDNAKNGHPNFGRTGVATQPFASGAVRRGSSGNSQYSNRGGGHRGKRPSVSSRRSSSINSRRSSGASVQMIMLDSPQVPTRRSFGSHTPNSERGDYSSRPSSIRSFSMQARHRKSPSASSSGSTHFRTASPMQKYHRRGGSGSSTRVVRQIQTNLPRTPHVRSNSATSSIHSPPSSRPTSFYEQSESEGPRTSSPYKSRSRRSSEDGSHRRSGNSGTTFVAQKRQGPFASPATRGHAYSLGKSSWKKSWGLEPPGWQSRTAHIPVEVLAISPAADPTSLRDVFSGRQSLNMGDESDWVDEDDDIPAFAGGLGQMGASVSLLSPSGLPSVEAVEKTITLSPVPRTHRASGVKRVGGRASTPGSSGGSRQKSGHSPSERLSPIPAESPYEGVGGRRQLPGGRSGPAFRHAIQEEDEGEEE